MPNPNKEMHEQLENESELVPGTVDADCEYVEESPEVLSVPFVLGLNARLPEFKTEGAAGCDLYAAESGVIMPAEVVGIRDTSVNEAPWTTWEEVPLNEAQKLVVKHEPLLVSLNLGLELPEGVGMFLKGRSGLAFNENVEPFEGTIDADFRGTVKVKVYNLGMVPFVVNVGDRIAQAVFLKVERPEFVVVDKLGVTERGEGGFESTGRRDG